ncbi:MAG: Bro-N domain-containing protein [Lactobacillus iners]|nr:Bro-N domain-containing protein [Lactobacillus iners]
MENIENGILTLLFENNEVKIRTINSEPYFNLENVCEILEIENPRRAKERLDEQGVYLLFDYWSSKSQRKDFISESNLYKLILQSHRLENIKFAEWVMSEVSPIFIRNKVAKKIIKELEGLRTKDLEKLMERIK